MNTNEMYKITKGNKTYYAKNYNQALVLFHRLREDKNITRLYCNLGNGYDLMIARSSRFRNL